MAVPETPASQMVFATGARISVRSENLKGMSHGPVLRLVQLGSPQRNRLVTAKARTSRPSRRVVVLEGGAAGGVPEVKGRRSSVGGGGGGARWRGVSCRSEGARGKELGGKGMRRWLGSWSRPCSRDMVLFVTMVLWLLSMWLPSGQTMLSQQERLQLREETREMFYHSFSSYMKYAYPLDELMPLSCKGRDWRNKDRGTLDDVLGGYALTLIDSLDMLAVLGDFDRFYDGVLLVIRDVSFERNVTVSVFEATIRLLGGLLSAHSLLEAEELEPVFRNREPRYEGELLDLAYDLGMRLLPAFDTRTGIPVHRVNLLVGVPLNETRETCVAAAGTLILEFGLLSRLTGDHRFERAARRALKALWDRRSSINLVGSTIHTQTGRWLQTHTGVGAGVDSWYEYLLKGAILFGDEELLDWFQTAYAAVQDHTLWGSWNVEVSMAKGKWQPHSFRVSALQAFWPSVQVLAGELTAAKASHRAFYSLWREFRALPEIFDARGRQLIHFARDSPLRPEFVESTYHLYLATRDPHYLNVGKEVLFSLQNLSRVGCGFAAIADVSSSPLRLDDRMDSFFLAETLKYLYLLFDQSLEPAKQSSLFCPWGPPTDASYDGPTSNKVHVTNASSAGSRGVGGGGPSSACLPLVRTIFTTEGHIFLVQDQVDGSRPRHKRKGNKPRSKLGSVTQNVVHEVTQKKAQSSGAGGGGRAAGGSGSLKSTPVPSAVAPPQWGNAGGSNMPHVTGTKARKAAQAAAVPKALPKDYRQCSAPSGGGDEAGAAAAEDSPVDTLEQEVVKAMQYMEPMPSTAMDAGSTDVQVSPDLVVQCDEGARCRVGRIARSPAKVVLSIRQLGGSKGPLSDSKPMETALVGYPANFGPDLRRVGMVTAWLHAPFHKVVETPITRRRFYACERFSPQEADDMRGSVVVVMRGVCSFVEKIRHLQQAGAAGVLILDFNPPPGADNDDGGLGKGDGGDADSLESLYLSWQVMADDGSGSDIDIPAALLTGRSARTVKRLLDRSDRLQRSSDGTYSVMVTMSPDAEALTVVEEEDMREVGVTAKGGYSGYQFIDVNVGEGIDSMLRSMLDSLFSRAGFGGVAQGAPGVGQGAHETQEQFTAGRRSGEGAAPSGADRGEGRQGNAFSSDASRPRRGASRSLASPIVTTTVVRSLSEAASGPVLTGKVKGFDQKKGWGFITPDNGAADVFVHQTEVRRSGYRFLKVGEDVEFVLDETDGRKAKNVTGPGGDLLPARQPRLQFRDSRSPGGYGDDRPRRPRYDRSYEGGDSSYGDRPRGRSSPRQARGDDEYAEDMSYAERPQRRAQGGYIKEDEYDDKEYDRDLGKPTEDEFRHVQHEQTLAQDAVEQDHKSHAK